MGMGPIHGDRVRNSLLKKNHWVFLAGGSATESGTVPGAAISQFKPNFRKNYPGIKIMRLTFVVVALTQYNKWYQLTQRMEMKFTQCNGD